MIRKISLGIVLWMGISSAFVWAQPRIGLRVAASINEDHFYSKYGFAPLGLKEEHTEIHQSPVLPNAGVFLLLGAPKGFRFLTELEYQPKRIYERARISGSFPGSYKFGDQVFSNTIHYGAIGAIMRYHSPQIFDLLQIFIDTGLRGNVKIADEGDIPEAFNGEETLNLRALDVSVRFGVGMRFEIRKYLSFFWDLRYEPSLTKASNYGLSILGIGAADYHRLRTYSLGIGVMF